MTTRLESFGRSLDLLLQKDSIKVGEPEQEKPKATAPVIPDVLDKPRLLKKDYWRVIHVSCKKTAFFYKKSPLDIPLSSENTILLNGKKPSPSSPVSCGSCGASMIFNRVDCRLEEV